MLLLLRFSPILLLLVQGSCLHSTNLFCWTGVTLMVPFRPPVTCWFMVHPRVMFVCPSPTCPPKVVICICSRRICPLRIALRSLLPLMASSIGPPCGGPFPFSTWSVRSLILTGRSLKEFFTLPSALPLLVCLFRCLAFVVHLLSLLSIFSFPVPSHRVYCPGSSPLCLISLTCLRLSYVVMLFLALVLTSCV